MATMAKNDAARIAKKRRTRDDEARAPSFSAGAPLQLCLWSQVAFRVDVHIVRPWSVRRAACGFNLQEADSRGGDCSFLRRLLRLRCAEKLVISTGRVRRRPACQRRRQRGPLTVTDGVNDSAACGTTLR
jgi:hypothetical protein